MIKKAMILALLLSTGSIFSCCCGCMHKKVTHMRKTVHAMSDVCQLLLKTYKAETDLFDQVLDYLNQELLELMGTSDANEALIYRLYQLNEYLRLEEQHEFDQFAQELKQDICNQ